MCRVHWFPREFSITQLSTSDCRNIWRGGYIPFCSKHQVQGTHFLQRNQNYHPYPCSYNCPSNLQTDILNWHHDKKVLVQTTRSDVMFPGIKLVLQRFLATLSGSTLFQKHLLQDEDFSKCSMNAQSFKNHLFCFRQEGFLQLCCAYDDMILLFNYN